MSKNEQLYIVNVAYAEGNGASYAHKNFKDALNEAEQIVSDIIDEYNGEDYRYGTLCEGNVFVDEDNEWYTAVIEYKGDNEVYAIITVSKVYNNL